MAALILRQQKSGEGDVLEFPQVAGGFLKGQFPLMRPMKRFFQLALFEPDARLQRQNWANIWGKITAIDRLCLREPGERVLQLALGFSYARHCNAPAIRVFQ